MTRKLDQDTLSRRLGTQRRGRIGAESGCFGAWKIAREIVERLKTPAGADHVYPGDPAP